MAKQEDLKELSEDERELRDSIFNKFSALEDPRAKDNQLHRFQDIVFMVVCAVMSGCNHLSDIITYIQSKRDWLVTVLQLKNGLPSYKCIWWILVRCDPVGLHEAFTDWLSDLGNKANPPPGGEVIAIDGKTSRRTRRGEQGPLHIVTALATERGVIMGQIATDDKSNEITAIPKLLRLLDIKGATVTIDAMGTQKAIAKQIRDQEGDYILALKGNQDTMHKEVKSFFEGEQVAEKRTNVDRPKTVFHCFEEADKGHGRIEHRSLRATEEIEWLHQRNQWKNLRTIIEVKSERTIRGVTTTETRYYISNRPPDAKALLTAIRRHWAIENELHWVLDVAFEDDLGRANTGHAAENIVLLKRYCLNALKGDKSVKESIERKRKRAGWDNAYLLRLMGW